MREHLVGALARVIPQDIRIATAYLTPDGFLDLKDAMDSAPQRATSPGGAALHEPERAGGCAVSTRRTVTSFTAPPSRWTGTRSLKVGYPWLLLTHEERRELLARGITPEAGAFDLTAWERVTTLADFLRRDSVEVRRFLGSDKGKVLPERCWDHRSPRNRLHAKAYLFSGEMGRYAAVGSSNLTKSGLSENSELNLASYDRELAAHLEGLVRREVGAWPGLQGTVHPAPGRVCPCSGDATHHGRSCSSHFTPPMAGFLEMGLSEEVMGRFGRIFSSRLSQRCVRITETPTGGPCCATRLAWARPTKGWASFGSSPTSGAMTLNGRESRRERLIVCPAQLQDNWSADRFAEWGIIATTVTMESLPSLADIEEEPSPVQRQRLRAELNRYQDQYDVILVDESHNFRNPRTKRYRALMEIIRGGKPDTRVVLMTATPINNSVWDLYHQLMLITRGDDTWYAGRGPIPNLKAAFQAIEKGESDSGLLDTMMLSSGTPDPSRYSVHAGGRGDHGGQRADAALPGARDTESGGLQPARPVRKTSTTTSLTPSSTSTSLFIAWTNTA